MRVAIYARVSTEAQEARGTIGSQCAALRERAAAEGHELVAEFLDDGHSGARLDRPGLDALRDAAEAGLLDAVWCLSPDRLARVYAYQVIVLDELARHGVAVLFADAPALDDDPQARLLTQVQGVIAEYERHAEFGMSLVMPSTRLCRAAGETSGRTSLIEQWSRHNHRSSRKARRVSCGR
jgi:site-specific DNA recombinase